MKKNHVLSLAIWALITPYLLFSGSYSSQSEMVKIFSPNENSYLISIPYDGNSETNYGKTTIFMNGKEVPIYTINRDFIPGRVYQKIFLSDDGESICYFNIADNPRDSENLALVFFHRGVFQRGYCYNDISECSREEEDCFILYTNNNITQQDTIKVGKGEFQRLIPRDKDTLINDMRYNLYKESAPAIEKFADRYKIFQFKDTIYLITSKMNVEMFNIHDGTRFGNKPLESIFDAVRDNVKFAKRELTELTSISSYDGPKVKGGKSFEKYLADSLDMNKFDYESDTSMFKYSIWADYLIDKSGNYELLNLRNYDSLPQNRLTYLLKNIEFEKPQLDKNLDKWLFTYNCELRSKSDSIAHEEFKIDQERKYQLYLKRTKLDSIAGVYIPTNIEDCYRQLDILLPEKIKKMIDTMKSDDDMGQFHMGLGMWIRNNWSLWGGSRLSVYFNEMGVFHPDDISGIILKAYYYHRHKKSFDPSEDIKFYQEYWKKVNDSNEK